MKSRKQLEKLRESKSWIQRRKLAQDQLPGTKFDALIENLLSALPYAKPDATPRYTDKGFDTEGIARDTIFSFGKYLAEAMKDGNSQLFLDWAEAVQTLREHRRNRQPDKLRAAIIDFFVPPDDKIPYVIPLAQGHSKPRRMNRTNKDLLTYLKSRGIDTGNDANQRAAYRVVDELGHKFIRGKVGRPPKA